MAQLSTDALFRQATVERLSNDEYAIMAPRAAAALMDAMSDEFSRRILSCSIRKGRSVDEICIEQGVPPSTCYKRMRHLMDIGAIVIERMVVPPTGKRYAVYRSAFSRLEVIWENGSLSAHATVNPDVAEKLQNVWLAMLRKEGKPQGRESLVARQAETGPASR